MIGIIILNYRNWNDSLECIQSIFNTTNEKYHIYFVDNASPNKIDSKLKNIMHKENITFILNNKNNGYAAGNNVGIKRALQDGCEYILISNNDVRFFPGSISALKEYLEKHKETGIVGPKIINASGKTVKTNICMKTGLKEKYMVRTRANVFFRKKYINYFGLDQNYNESFPVYAVVGCCFMISRKCALEITPLDENTFLYEEEFIIGIRMEQKGYRTMYFPKSVIQHLHGKSTDSVKPFAFTCMICSEIYYCYAYLKAEKWQIYPLYLYRMILYLLRCIKSAEFRKKFGEYRRTVKKALDDKGLVWR